jgi:hypothetical protein
MSFPPKRADPFSFRVRFGANASARSAEGTSLRSHHVHFRRPLPATHRSAATQNEPLCHPDRSEPTHFSSHSLLRTHGLAQWRDLGLISAPPDSMKPPQSCWWINAAKYHESAATSHCSMYSVSIFLSAYAPHHPNHRPLQPLRRPLPQSPQIPPNRSRRRHPLLTLFQLLHPLRSSLLKQSLATAGFQYLYLGRELGGRPEGDQYYDAKGHVLYPQKSPSTTGESSAPQ